ncbi:Hypothetical predicted protein [Xyrichtys novacula]|uniref:Uncharacterized protein n=1 Tax=Xyrichtys novacula TaxID=13765 RepID=A0AAV1G3B6_XYRNO|nr:Hypothetical predicted protein [Xyrichtys novacula]
MKISVLAPPPVRLIGPLTCRPLITGGLEVPAGSTLLSCAVGVGGDVVLTPDSDLRVWELISPLLVPDLVAPICLLLDVGLLSSSESEQIASRRQLDPET